MRFDDRQMLTVNADVNNFNQDRQMFDLGDMSDNSPWGKISAKTARFSYYIEPNKTWRFTADGKISRKDTDKQSWENNETYLSPDNLMNRHAENFDGEDVTATVSTALRVRKSGRWQHALSYKFDYARSRDVRDSRSLSYLPAKAAWEGIQIDSIIRLEEKETSENALLYSLLDPELSRSRSVIHSPKWQSSFVFGADLLNFNASLKHETKTQRDFSNYRLTTYADGTTDARRRYLNLRDYFLEFHPELELVHQYENPKRYNGVVKPFLRYSHRYGTVDHPEYRLERMTEWFGLQSWGLESLGRLPETEWQARCLDEANSYCSTEREEKTEAGVHLSHKVLFERGTSLLIEADESFYYQHRTLGYDREGCRHSPRREGFFFRPASAFISKCMTFWRKPPRIAAR